MKNPLASRLILLLAVSLTAALGVSLFLFLLGLAASFFKANWSWAVVLLPLVGLFVFWLPKLKIFENRDLSAPLALCSHLFGACVGRESAAVQIGKSTASAWVRFFGATDLEFNLRMGMAAGFASAFGTPWAGAVFALEHPGPPGKMKWSHQAVWMLMAAMISFAASNFILPWLGVLHFHWPPVQFSWADIDPWELVFLSLGLSAFATFFEFFLQRINSRAKKIPGGLSLFAGGTIVALLTYQIGSTQFNGLGTELTTLALQQEGSWSLLLYKTLFLLVSVGTGFPGGEVTPLISLAALFADVMTSSVVLVAASVSCLFAHRLRAPTAGVIILVEFFNWKVALVGAVPILTTLVLHRAILSTSLTLKRHFAGTE